MNGEAPRFCTSLESYFYSELNSKIKSKKRYTLVNNDSSIYLNIQKKILEKNKNNINDKPIKIRNRNYSVKFKIRNYKTNNDIQEFMKKDKFKLRNDFDKKNVKKFLSSKEEAFENSFLEIKDVLNKE